jgi:hypothetical protein
MNVNLTLPAPTRKELAVIGGAAALALSGIVEGPVALVLAAVPLVRAHLTPDRDGRQPLLRASITTETPSRARAARGDGASRTTARRRTAATAGTRATSTRRTSSTRGRRTATRAASA